MITELSNFAARLRERISVGDDVRSLILQNRKSEIGNRKLSEPPHVGSYEEDFNQLALELFALQFKYNFAYRLICEAQRRTPEVVEHWTRIPAVPTAAFKELELTCLAPSERTAVFHSSGTTKQKPSRHFHNADSLTVYEASLWKWFVQNIFANSKLKTQNSKLICLTPLPEQAPHSSLVHMFKTIRQKLDAQESVFVGKIDADGAWVLDFEAALAALDGNSKLKTHLPRHSAATAGNSKLILGTAFSFVHLLDFLTENNLHFRLPIGSRVMETGGYKSRSRTMSKDELHALITERLGIPQSHIVCEYGMSELSSQAYDAEISIQNSKLKIQNSEREFRFPPWARVQIISPENGCEVADGETGLIRVFDLANVFSVMAIQTEDLGVRHGDGFELIGRAQFAEPRGCSLMSIESE